MTATTTFHAAEHELLLRSIDAGAGDAELTRLLRGVAWDALLALAARERAAADLYRRVRHLPAIDVPPDALVVLRRLAMISDFEMGHAEECLDEVLRLAASLGIRVMLLKGAAVAHTVYGGDLRRRPMSDLDLLVDPTSATVLQRALMAGRWRLEREGSGAPYHAHHHLPPLRDARGSALVLELHTGLFPAGTPLGLTAALLWPRGVPMQPRSGAALGGVYVPAVAHQMLHVCLHFAWSHAMKFGTWRTFRDVSALAGAPDVDWDEIIRLARHTRAVTACYWTFRLARTAARAAVPDEVCAALRPPRPESYLRRLESHYLLNLFPARQACPSVRLDRVLWDMGMLPGWSGHGEARPWDHDERFLAVARVLPATPRRARVRSLWEATRYLGAVMARSGSAAEATP